MAGGPSVASMEDFPKSYQFLARKTIGRAGGGDGVEFLREYEKCFEKREEFFFLLIVLKLWIINEINGTKLEFIRSSCGVEIFLTHTIQHTPRFIHRRYSFYI